MGLKERIFGPSREAEYFKQRFELGNISASRERVEERAKAYAMLRQIPVQIDERGNLTPESRQGIADEWESDPEHVNVHPRYAEEIRQGVEGGYWPKHIHEEFSQRAQFPRIPKHK